MEFGMWLPLVLVPIMVGWMLYSRLQLNRGKAEHSDKNAGKVADRMGLTLVQGDPSLNLLYFEQPYGNFERTIRMEGRPYEHHVEFWIDESRKTSEFVVASKTTTSFGSCLQVSVPGNTAFEVVLRDPNQYLVVGREYTDRQLQEVSTGVPALDEHFVVRAQHPAVGPQLVPALQILASHLYVHLAGGPQRIWIKIERVGLGYVVAAPEEYVLALESAACGLEGKPAPAALPSAEVY